LFVPEGERDCETLREHGLVATTNPMGAESWREEFNPFFSGRQVIILPDDDSPGWKRAFGIAKGVLQYAASVSIISFEPCKDVTDWFLRGHSELEFIGMVEDCKYARLRA
jgi:putative DNA primase/helicase